VAVGDAAFAHDPVSGQGIRFGLASALAATAVIRTWCRRPDDQSLAARFYEEFVATERSRHCALLRALYGTQFDFGRLDDDWSCRGSPSLAVTYPPSENAYLQFVGKIESAPLHVGGLIEAGEAIRLADGGAVRWLGGVDLLRLRDYARAPIRLDELAKLIAAGGVTMKQSLKVIEWCYAKKILRGRPNSELP
jgi:hypothetical protein